MFTRVRQAIAVRIVVTEGAWVPVTAELTYDSGDPFAIRMTFPSGSTMSGDSVEWTFARDLLGAGLGKPAGLGDVRIWPLGPGKTAVAFQAPEGAALIEASSADLMRFLDRTYAAVPSGSERRVSDVDGELAALLFRD